MKRILTILLVLILSACEAQVMTVPVFIYDNSDAYMAEFETNIRQAALSKTYLIRSFNSQNSQIIQNDQIEQFMSKDYPVLMINPVDRLSVYAIIEKAKQNDSTIIFFNREPLPEDIALYDKVYYVGADAIQSAQLQASLIMDLFGNNPRVLNEYDKNGDGIIQTVILKGEQGHQDAEARTKHVIESLTSAGYKIEVLDVSIANWDRETAQAQMKELITLYGEDIEILISNNDAMALGAIETLKTFKFFDDLNQDGVIDREVEPWLPVVGIDGLEVSIESIKQGYLYGTIKNDSESMADCLVQLTEWLLAGKPLIDFPYKITDGKYLWINYQKLSLEE
jgi:methyl-galactoside transport system substrate-binding protein